MADDRKTRPPLGRFYGVCPACAGAFTLRKDGLLRHHLGNEWESNGIFRKLCPGVGQLPEADA